ncbi:MAG TPA: matrixin family metalloprotease [Pyrinomonadaceae bacterium]
MLRRCKKITFAFLTLAAISSVFGKPPSYGNDEVATNLRWRSGIIRIAVSSSLLRENPNIKTDSDVTGAIKRSIATWSRVVNIELQQVTSDKVSASPAGAAGDGVSLITIAATPENVLLFAKDPDNAAATTRVFYNRRGVITEADIVLNPYQQFSTDGTVGTFDLESTLTHEIGHLLGLSHSFVLGSTMHSSNARNGVFGLQSFSSRTLTANDIAAVRALYGVGDENADCCGSIEGRISFAGKQVRNVEVWVEDSTGRVQGSARAGGGEEFRFDGLSTGKYKVLAHELGRAKTALPVQELGTVTVSAGETSQVAAKASLANRDIELSYMGFNGQLSDMAVPLTAGRSYTIYLGGRNLDPKRVSLSFSSPNLVLVPSTLRSLDYGPDLSVISFELKVKSRTAKGEYSIFAESQRGDRRVIIGGLTVDDFPNPWQTFSGLDD